MNVTGYIVVMTMGEQPFCAREKVKHFRRSWVDSDRCTAIMVGTMMLLSENMPHSGRDEEDYIEALETVSR